MSFQVSVSTQEEQRLGSGYTNQAMVSVHYIEKEIVFLTFGKGCSNMLVTLPTTSFRIVWTSARFRYMSSAICSFCMLLDL